MFILTLVSSVHPPPPPPLPAEVGCQRCYDDGTAGASAAHPVIILVGINCVCVCVFNDVKSLSYLNTTPIEHAERLGIFRRLHPAADTPRLMSSL